MRSPSLLREPHAARQRGVQQDFLFLALLILATHSENAVTIATAGGAMTLNPAVFPPLAQLLFRSGADDDIKAVAVDALEAIRKGVAENRAAAGAAKASADVVQAMERLGVDSPSDVQS
jgi:hypothetical protein